MHEYKVIDGRKVYQLTEEETEHFKKIGSASGPSFEFCTYEGWKHEENFLKRVAGYQISEGGIAAMIDEVQEKAGLKKPKYINVTFYEKDSEEAGK